MKEGDQTFHTCSADLISLSYTYDPVSSIFLLTMMALFNSSFASTTVFSDDDIKEREEKRERRKRQTYFEQ